MSQVLECGVVGAGVFGGYHARQYAALPETRLAAVYDPDLDRAKALAELHGAEHFDALEPFLDAVGAVSVTSPAVTHASLARSVLKRGRHLYVEKPIATSVEEAEELLELAAGRGLVLSVGHQERIVMEAMGLLGAPEAPVLLEAVRRGPSSPRNRDVSCVLDLMIHDLDLALALTAADPLAVEAEARTREGPYFDEVEAEVVFSDGLVARFSTSRMASERERRMRLVYPSGAVEVDFLSRRFVNETPFSLDKDFAEGPSGSDPLKASLRAFCAAARSGRGGGEGARQAVRALDLALAVEQAAGG